MRVRLEQGVAAGSHAVGDRLGEHLHVGHGQVQALRSGRGHDVRGVAGEVEPPMLHRLDDEAPHAGDPFLEHRAFAQCPAVEPGPELELLPDAVVGPAGDILVVGDLDVVTRELWRAKGEEGEAAVMVGVDELVHGGLDLGEDPEPAEGILALEAAEDAGGNGPAADPVEAVAAREDVALELVVATLVREGEARPVGRQVVNGDVACLEEERQPTLDARGDQVLDDLRLAVDHDRASGQLAERHVVTLALELEVDPVVHDPLALEPGAGADLAKEVGVPLLDHAGADPLLAVLAASRLDDDRLDPLGLEDPRQGEAGRPGADDADPGLHSLSASTLRNTLNAWLAAGTPQ